MCSNKVMTQPELSVWDTIWQQISEVTPLLDLTPVLIIGAAVLALVAWHPTWRVLRNVVTIVHEGCHAFMALLAGRQLGAITLHSDTSGLTVTRGRPRGLGMILTAAAGYTGPAVTGLLGAWVLSRGWSAGLLWGFVLILALMLLKIRNWYGLWSLLATGVVIGVVTFFAPAAVQVYLAYALVLFLLFAAPRPVLELTSQRRRTPARARTSDADMLGQITWLPAPVWLAIFLILTLGCLTLGAWLILP